MYDELIKRLRRCAVGFKCRECEYDNLNGCRTTLNTEAADAIEELQSIVKQFQKTHDDRIDFLEFLFNHIQPNEMEHYWTMFHCLDVPTCGESEGE